MPIYGVDSSTDHMERPSVVIRQPDRREPRHIAVSVLVVIVAMGAVSLYFFVKGPVSFYLGSAILIADAVVLIKYGYWKNRT